MKAAGLKLDAQVRALQDASAPLLSQATKLGGSGSLISILPALPLDAVTSIQQMADRNAVQARNVRLLNESRRRLHDDNLFIRGTIRSILRVRPADMSESLVNFPFPCFEHSELEVDGKDGDSTRCLSLLPAMERSLSTR